MNALPPIDFRPLATADLPVLHTWLGRPHVAEWWDGAPTLDDVIADYGPLVGSEGPHRAYIAYLGDRPLGFIKSYTPALTHDEGWWLDEHDPGVRGIDQFLANASDLGQGLGTRLVRAFLDALFRDPTVTRVQTDPSPANGRAIRCYEKAGFVAHGVVETPDGAALLMYCERS